MERKRGNKRAGSAAFQMKSSPAKLFGLFNKLRGRKKVYDPETNMTTTYNKYGEAVKSKHHKTRG